ncbi:TIGR03546 family protein [Petrachloros mirabilis]
MLQTVAKFLKILNSDAEPGQISLGFAFAMLAGFTPLMSLHNLLVLLLVLFLRVNLSSFLLGLALFSALAFALDPLFHQIGLAVLTLPALNGLWTTLFNSTLWRLERFNNSIVMGSLVVSLTLFVPMVIVGNLLVRKYREHVLQWVMKTRLMQAFQASKLFNYYQSASGWGD